MKQSSCTPLPLFLMLAIFCLVPVLHVYESSANPVPGATYWCEIGLDKPDKIYCSGDYIQITLYFKSAGIEWIGVFDPETLEVLVHGPYGTKNITRDFKRESMGFYWAKEKLGNPGTRTIEVNATLGDLLIRASQTFEVKDCYGGCPDLEVQNIWIEPASFAPNQTVTIKFTAKNAGNVDAGPFKIALLLDNVEIGSANLNGLAAGKVVEGFKDGFIWPSDIHCHNVKVIMDANNSVQECNERNNILEKTFCPTSQPTRKVRVYVYAINDENRSRGYQIETVYKIPGAKIRVDYPGGSTVLTTTSTYPGPYIEVEPNSTATVSLAEEPAGWKFAGYWDIYFVSWTQGPTRTFNVGTTDKHVAAAFVQAPRKVKVYVYAIDDANRTRGYLIDTVPKIAGAKIRVDYPGGSVVLTTTSTYPGPCIEVDENSTVTVSLVAEPPGWRFTNYWDIFGVSWTPGPTRTFNVGTTDKHVAAAFTHVVETVEIKVKGGYPKYQDTVFFRGTQIEVEVIGKYTPDVWIYELYRCSSLEGPAQVDPNVETVQFATTATKFIMPIPADTFPGRYRIRIVKSTSLVESPDFYVIFNPNVNAERNIVEDFYENDKTRWVDHWFSIIKFWSETRTNHFETEVLKYALGILYNSILTQESKAVEALICEFLDKKLKLKEPLSPPQQVKDLLRNPEVYGDCDVASVVAVALLRAIGIPARVIWGAFKRDWLSDLGHAWIEVWYNNSWNAIDLTIFMGANFGTDYKQFTYEFKARKKWSEPLWIVDEKDESRLEAYWGPDVWPTYTHIYGPSAGRYLVSTPVEEDSQKVFGVPVYEWDPLSKRYTTALKLHPTQGYMVSLPANKKVTVGGRITTEDQTILLDVPGWHLISTPWPYPKAAIQVIRDSETKSWQEAAAAGWIDDQIYGYTADRGYTNPTILDPWYGYFVKTKVHTLTLKLLYNSRVTTTTAVSALAPQALFIPEDLPLPPGYVCVASDEQEIVVNNHPNPICDVSTATFAVIGSLSAHTEMIRIRVFDLSGRLVWQGETKGVELVWHTEDFSGNYLANGVYLYIAEVKINGQWITLRPKKLAILR